MMRPRWTRRFTQLLLLIAPGAVMLQGATSCGDVLRQTLLTSGAEFLGTAATELLNQALTSALEGATGATATQ